MRLEAEGDEVHLKCISGAGLWHFLVRYEISIGCTVWYDMAFGKRGVNMRSCVGLRVI